MSEEKQGDFTKEEVEELVNLLVGTVIEATIKWQQSGVELQIIDEASGDEISGAKLVPRPGKERSGAIALIRDYVTPALQEVGIDLSLEPSF